MKKENATNLILCLSFLLLILSCSTENQTSNDSVETPIPDIPSTPVSYTNDVPGLLSKIKSEGSNDEAIAKNISEANQEITYKHLKKNAEKHAGEPWLFTGKILEISESDGNTFARIGLDKWGNDAIMVAGNFTTEFVDGERVFVVGYLAGNHSYTSQANWQITIPAMVARAMLKPSEKDKYKTQKN